jgi:phytoene dehydrogenase-like protein
MDWALSSPVPWANPRLLRAGTVHLGGTLEELAHAEREAWNGRRHDLPYVLLVQPTLFDPTRAPPGKHTLWAYGHVPHGTTDDYTSAIEAQTERFAPGFRDTILARSVLRPADLERFDPNLVGGDITGGAQIITQAFTRPVVRLDPYKTPLDGVYLCSASTPPGGGVHGMCGFNAAQSALAREFGIRQPAPALQR